MSPFSTWEAIRKVWVLLVGAGRDWGVPAPQRLHSGSHCGSGRPWALSPVPDTSVPPAPQGDGSQWWLWDVDQHDQRPATEDGSGQRAGAPPLRMGLQAPGRWVSVRREGIGSSVEDLRVCSTLAPRGHSEPASRSPQA